MSALLTVTSHIGGKNATVAIYPDRIEWLLRLMAGQTT